MAVSARKLSADDSTGPAIQMGTQQNIEEVPPGADIETLMRDVAFMAEWVEVIVFPKDEAAEPMVPVSVNGDRIVLRTGVPAKIRRYHLARLTQARGDVITHNEGTVEGPDSSRNRLHRRSHVQYNIEVLEDTPNGVAWLRQLRKNVTRQ